MTFRWVPEDHAKIWRAYDYNVKEKFRQLINRTKKEVETKAGGPGTDIEAWKKFPPLFMTEDTWCALVDIFKTPEYQRKCAQGRANRGSHLPGRRTYHTGGSAPIARTRQRMIAENPGTTMLQVFKRTHCRNKGEGPFVSDKAENIHNRVQEAMIAKHGPIIEDHPQDDDDVWLSVAPVAKGRVFGHGDGRPDSMVGRRGRAEDIDVGGYTSTVDQIVTQRLRESQNTMREQIQSEHNTRLEEAITKERDDHNTRLEEAIAKERADHNTRLEEAIAKERADHKTQLVAAITKERADHKNELKAAIEKERSEREAALQTERDANDARFKALEELLFRQRN